MKKILILLALLVPSVFAQEILIDGSSTVYPITLAVAEEFNIDNPDSPATVAFSGTGGGFEKFCAGEIVMNNASRPIKQEEADACAANGIEFIEVEVALDALTVVVNPENDWAQCVTMDQLKGMWQPEPTINNWSDVNPDYPAEPIVLYGPGVDSGTFDYFTEAVVGEAGSSRSDFFPSEDDTVLVQGVEGDANALGYFGFAYYLEEGEKLKGLEIDGGEGCVAPTAENVNNDTYPLSRPLFIYVSKPALAENPGLVSFVDFYLSDDAKELISDTGYVLLTDEMYEAERGEFEAR
ncbi:MAG: PstS family phosphate ABC transporter substrate-binding protein [Trueperaceae bacterium]